MPSSDGEDPKPGAGTADPSTNDHDDIQKDLDIAAKNAASMTKGSGSHGGGDDHKDAPRRRRTTFAPEVRKTGVGGVRDPIVPLWTKFTDIFRLGMSRAVTKAAVHAARHPEAYIIGITLLSVVLVGVGFATNFKLELDFEKVFTPLNSRPADHNDWINSPEGFPDKTRKLILLYHNDGETILTKEAMERVFLGVKTIRETPGYDELCEKGVYVDFENANTCRIMSATGYWDHHSLEAFHNSTAWTNNDDNVELKRRLSSFEFANGSPVYHDAIMGNWEKDNTGNLTMAQSYLITIEIPDVDPDANTFEEAMLERLADLRNDFIAQDGVSGVKISTMDVMTIYAYELEYARAIYGDIYLVAIVVFVMCAFVASCFGRFGGMGEEEIKSRSLLGMLAVYTIGCSFLTGNGIMFIAGVPFTTITQILPFVVVGIGLDDTFIITGAYFRTDPELLIEERIQITMEEVSHSILLTTITTTFAFLLGLLSSLPGVQWLCLYAFVTIFVDFIYQITMFTAFIVMDERRIQANRRDCCFCWFYPESDETTDDEALDAIAEGKDEDAPEQAEEEEEEYNPISGKEADNEEPPAGTSRKSMMANKKKDMVDIKINKMDARRMSFVPAAPKSLPERIMSKYADYLLTPVGKTIVLVAFGAFFGVCCWRATMLKQDFKLGDFVPKDSYLRNILYSFEAYASVIRPFAIYFRFIDQADPDIQQQMINYVNDLETLPQISSSIPVDLTGNDNPAFAGIDEVKPFCWVRDWQTFGPAISQQEGFEFFADLDFKTQLEIAFNNPTFREVYGSDIIRDEDGNITASRCWAFLSELNLNSVEAQLDMLHDQRKIGEVQPLNIAHNDEWRFFLFDTLLFYWEAYDAAIKELVFTIISGVVALAVISFLLIPHWTAAFFVTPFIVMLYINYLGTLQMLGLDINGIFYICVVVAVGLLVDFLMHMLLRYYETSCSKTRDARVRETLETMGASILLGGLTTFLGVVPLCFSSTKIFLFIFFAFFGMIVLGVAHGLILLPVILSIIGPTTGLEEHQSEVQAKREKRDSRRITVPRASLYNFAETDESVMMALREYDDLEPSTRDMGPITIPHRRDTMTEVEC